MGRRNIVWILCGLVAVTVVAGCRRSSNRTRKPMTEEEYQLASYVLPGCSPDPTTTPEELVLYCPDQAVFFAVRDIRERSPDKVFNDWIEEFSQRSGGQLDVLERTQVKFYGPQYTSLYVRMRTPEMPEGGYIEGIVALTEVNGKPRRVWCSATGSEPMGIRRCEHDLPVVALIDVPKG